MLLIVLFRQLSNLGFTACYLDPAATQGEQQIVIEFPASDVLGRDAAIWVLLQTWGRAFQELSKFFSNLGCISGWGKSTTRSSLLSNVSHLDRPSRAAGLGDDGSSVGLQTTGVLIVPPIRGCLSREETAMVDTRQHAVQTFRRTCDQGEKIYGPKVIREYSNLVGAWALRRL